MYVDLDKIFEGLPSFKEQQSIYQNAMTYSIEDAQAIIDSILSNVATVPFPDYNAAATPNPCPAIVTTVTTLLAKAIFLGDSYRAEASNAETKSSKSLYDRAMDLLEKLQSGKMAIVGGTPNAGSNNLGVYSSTRGKQSALKYFDLESQLRPSLHRRMRDPNCQLRRWISDEELAG